MGNKFHLHGFLWLWLALGGICFVLGSCHECAVQKKSSVSPPITTADSPDQPQKLITIKPVMPLPVWIGWGMGKFVHLPNLELPSKHVQSGELPEGTHLLSLNAPVTSSCSMPDTGTLDMLTDGSKEGADGYFVELGPGKQWIQVDLGQTKEIWGIWLWHFHKMPAIYKGVIIQVGTNPDGQNFTTLFNNDHENTMGLGVGHDPLYEESCTGRYVAGNGVSARYVRFWSCGHYVGPPLEMRPDSHYTEVEIYGK